LQTSRSEKTTTTKTLLALLAAGILVTGATFFAVPPQVAFADHEGVDHDDEEQELDDNDDEVLYEDEEDLDIEVFDSNGREYFGDYDNDDVCQKQSIDDDRCFGKDYDNDDNDNPETWINWVRTLDGGKNVRDGGHINSNHFKVDFQSTATDTGSGSHVDLSIDGSRYYAVASPHTFTIASDGYHTISLKGVDNHDNEDRTPAKFSFTIVKNVNDNNDGKNKINHKDLYNKIEDSENDVQDTVKDSEKDIKNKVEDSENDVIFAIEKKLNKLEGTITEEHAVQDEELQDIQKDINKLRQGQQNLSDDLNDRIDKLEKKLLKAMEENEKALKAKIEDSEGDVKRKVEDSEDDVIKQINALWDWLRDLVAEFAKALGLIAAAEEEKK
jgi:hypothetical protein